MHDIPLIGPYSPDDVLAWEPDGSRTARQFVSDVARLAESLPDRLTVINLATSRYEFLVGFAAAILRRYSSSPGTGAAASTSEIASFTREPRGN